MEKYKGDIMFQRAFKISIFLIVASLYGGVGYSMEKKEEPKGSQLSNVIQDFKDKLFAVKESLGGGKAAKKKLLGEVAELKKCKGEQNQQSFDEKVKELLEKSPKLCEKEEKQVAFSLGTKSIVENVQKQNTIKKLAKEKKKEALVAAKLENMKKDKTTWGVIINKDEWKVLGVEGVCQLISSDDKKPSLNVSVNDLKLSELDFCSILNTVAVQSYEKLELNLCFNNITDEVVDSIENCLKNKNLKELSLWLTSTGLNDKKAEKILADIGTIINLSNLLLNLSLNENLMQRSLNQLCMVLKNLEKLQVLMVCFVLNKNMFRSTEVKNNSTVNFMESLCELKNISNLDLDISACGISLLNLDALGSLKNLRKLKIDCAHNLIADEVCIDLKNLEQLKSIYLNFIGNKIKNMTIVFNEKVFLSEFYLALQNNPLEMIKITPDWLENVEGFKSSNFQINLSDTNIDENDVSKMISNWKNNFENINKISSLTLSDVKLPEDFYKNDGNKDLQRWNIFLKKEDSIKSDIQESLKKFADTEDFNFFNRLIVLVKFEKTSSEQKNKIYKEILAEKKIKPMILKTSECDRKFLFGDLREFLEESPNLNFYLQVIGALSGIMMNESQLNKQDVSEDIIINFDSILQGPINQLASLKYASHEGEIGGVKAEQLRTFIVDSLIPHIERKYKNFPLAIFKDYETRLNNLKTEIKLEKNGNLTLYKIDKWISEIIEINPFVIVNPHVKKMATLIKGLDDYEEVKNKPQILVTEPKSKYVLDVESQGHAHFVQDIIKQVMQNNDFFVNIVSAGKDKLFDENTVNFQQNQQYFLNFSFGTFKAEIFKYVAENYKDFVKKAFIAKSFGNYFAQQKTTIVDDEEEIIAKNAIVTDDFVLPMFEKEVLENYDNMFFVVNLDYDNLPSNSSNLSFQVMEKCKMAGKLSICAPGTDINALISGGLVLQGTGTSLSAPYVTVLGALGNCLFGLDSHKMYEIMKRSAKRNFQLPCWKEIKKRWRQPEDFQETIKRLKREKLKKFEVETKLTDLDATNVIEGFKKEIKKKEVALIQPTKEYFKKIENEELKLLQKALERFKEKVERYKSYSAYELWFNDQIEDLERIKSLLQQRNNFLKLAWEVEENQKKLIYVYDDQVYNSDELKDMKSSYVLIPFSGVHGLFGENGIIDPERMFFFAQLCKLLKQEVEGVKLLDNVIKIMENHEQKKQQQQHQIQDLSKEQIQQIWFFYERYYKSRIDNIEKRQKNLDKGEVSEDVKTNIKKRFIQILKEVKFFFDKKDNREEIKLKNGQTVWLPNQKKFSRFFDETVGIKAMGRKLGEVLQWRYQDEIEEWHKVFKEKQN
jgi:hypothetical protein